MKTIHASRRAHYLERFGIFLLTAALIVGIAGCGGDGGPYTLTISSTGGGKVTSPGEGTFTYDEGRLINLVAEAGEGYRFVDWSGHVSAIADVNAATTTIIMNDDHTITANFALPIWVWDWYDLDAIKDGMDGIYILMNDLDSTTAGYTELASPTADGGAGWQPIGNDDNLFTGIFDGQGYEICDLFINRPDEVFVGLFGYVDVGGVVQNVRVVNANVTGEECVGALVGENFIGSVSNSYSSGNVIGDGLVGGLVGENGGNVNNSYSSGNVTGEECVGGLVGVNGATVSNSYSIGTVTGSYDTGGLVGDSMYGTVSNSYYNYDNVLINGENIITIGALFNGDFDQWLANDKFLDVNERLSQEGGYYVINDVADFKQLLTFGQDNSLKFSLKNDLDLGDEPNFHIPYLAGEFDGNGYKISNLILDSDLVSPLGLFGYLAPGGKVTQVGVENLNVTGTLSVGGLVGGNRGTVSNSYSIGSVTGNVDVGGLVGYNVDDVVSSYSTGSVTGEECVGGVVGMNDGPVSNCYSSGNVTGDVWVGGLLGFSERVTISNCYAMGNVTGDSGVGGLVGGNDCTVRNSYSTGSVTGNEYVGGLVGRNWDTVSDSFWDIETSGQATSDGGTGKITAQMKSITTFTGAGWNVIAVANAGTRNPAYTWNIIDEQTYPFFGWQL